MVIYGQCQNIFLVNVKQMTKTYDGEIWMASQKLKLKKEEESMCSFCIVLEAGAVLRQSESSVNGNMTIKIEGESFTIMQFDLQNN